MILLMNEEGAYRHWITHHRDGFVLDGRHRPRWTQLMLHRAECSHIKHASTKRTHWTTGTRFKACSLDRQEIVEWVSNELGRPFEWCPDCSPDAESPAVANGHRQMSPLAAEIVDFVLEVATIHLDAESPPYHLTVQAIADCMRKTSAQVAPVLQRLIADAYLASDGQFTVRKTMRARQTVYPTANALRMLPYFTEMSEEALQAELNKLRGTPVCSTGA